MNITQNNTYAVVVNEAELRTLKYVLGILTGNLPKATEYDADIADDLYKEIEEWTV